MYGAIKVNRQYLHCFLELLLVMHNNGKKHQRLVKVREERKASAERSIYVRSFENRTTLESDLNEYFAQFGKVSNVFVDKEKVRHHANF